VNLLNFYADNNTKIEQHSMADIPEIPDFTNLQNLKVNVNTASVENLISNLNGLHIEISGLKGYEVNKMINPQKFATRREFYGTNQNTNTVNNMNNSTMNKKISNTGSGNIGGMTGVSDYIKSANMV